MNIIRLFAIASCVVLLAAPASGQSSCTDLSCPNGAPAVGNFPDACMCGKDPITVPPIGLSCQNSIQCIDSSQIPVGEWPACGCKNAEEAGKAPTGNTSTDTGFQPGSGGLATCNAVFRCPPKFKMAEQSNRCICQH
jgi:hypothetical protein